MKIKSAYKGTYLLWIKNCKEYEEVIGNVYGDDGDGFCCLLGRYRKQAFFFFFFFFLCFFLFLIIYP